MQAGTTPQNHRCRAIFESSTFPRERQTRKCMSPPVANPSCLVESQKGEWAVVIGSLSSGKVWKGWSRETDQNTCGHYEKPKPPPRPACFSLWILSTCQRRLKTQLQRTQMGSEQLTEELGGFVISPSILWYLSVFQLHVAQDNCTLTLCACLEGGESLHRRWKGQRRARAWAPKLSLVNENEPCPITEAPWASAITTLQVLMSATEGHGLFYFKSCFILWFCLLIFTYVSVWEHVHINASTQARRGHRIPTELEL